jgi:Caspase domain
VISEPKSIRQKSTNCKDPAITGAVGPAQVGGSDQVDDNHLTMVTATIETDASSCPSLHSLLPGQQALLVPSSPDFVMSYATLPGSPSYRHPEEGSLYIKELCKQLRGGRYDLDRCLMLVKQGVEEYLKKFAREEDCGRSATMTSDASSAVRDVVNGNAISQYPFHLTTGDKLIYLHS